MTAGIKYNDDELKFFLECNTVDNYLNVLRDEVIKNAKGRSYQFYIGENMKLLAYFKNGKLKKFNDNKTK